MDSVGASTDTTATSNRGGGGDATSSHPGGRAPRSSPSRQRPTPLSLPAATSQRRLSDRAALKESAPAGGGGVEAKTVPARRVIGSVVVASPARADVEEYERQRQARRDGAAAAHAGQPATTSNNAGSPLPLSRHGSTLSVRRLSLPSTPSLGASGRPAADSSTRRSRSSRGSLAPLHWSPALRVARTDSAFTIHSAAASTDVKRRASVASSSAAAARAMGAFDATELDIDACRAMLEQATVEGGLEGPAGPPLQLSEETVKQIQHNLARAIVNADKKRFAALLGLCKRIQSAMLQSATTTTTGAVAHLPAILDSVIDHDTGYTLAHLVVLADQPSLTHAALRYGTAVHSVEDVEGETALMLAMRRAPESVGVLMTLGKDVDVCRPLRMLVGESRRPLRKKLLDKAAFLRRWAVLAKGGGGHANEGEAGNTAKSGAALVPSHRNLLHVAVMADEATPEWPSRVAIVRQLIEQHGLDATQQDIFGFTPTLLAREHAPFLGDAKAFSLLLRTLKEAGLVQRLTSAAPANNASAARVMDAPGSATSKSRAGGVVAVVHEDARRHAGDARPAMSRLASFALSMRSATLLGGTSAGDDEEEEEDDVDAPFRRPRGRNSREHSIAFLAASLADLDGPRPDMDSDAASPLSLSSSSSASSLGSWARANETAAAAFRPSFLSVVPADVSEARDHTPLPIRPHYAVVASATGAGTSTPSPARPDGYVTLRLVSPSSTPVRPASDTGRSHTPTPRPPPALPTPPPASAALKAYVFPSSTVTDPREAQLSLAVPGSPLPRQPPAVPEPTVRPQAMPSKPQGAGGRGERVFVSQSPAATATATTASEALRRQLTLSPSPVGIAVDTNIHTTGLPNATHHCAQLRNRTHTPSPGIPLAMEGSEENRRTHKTGVLDSRVRARAAAVSAALSSMLQVTSVDRFRWYLIGPYTRLGCLLLVLVLNCISYGLDVACAYFREVRFGLWCRPLNLLLGNTWSGSAFFMGFTHVGCLVVGAVVGVLVVVLLCGRLLGCTLLKLPCFGAEDVQEAPFLERTFGLFVTSFYEPHKRPRLFLAPLGLLLGCYSGALVYNALLHRAWEGQVWWACAQPCLSSYSTYRTHFLAVWAVCLALNWLVVCFVGDVLYQEGLLGVFLPHFLFDRWANGLELTVYPWCRRWGCLWPVQAGRLRAMTVVQAAQDEAAASVSAGGKPGVSRSSAVESDSWHPSEVFDRIPKLAVHVEAFRLWLFWVVLLLGWALIAVIFVVVGVVGASASGSSTKAWYAHLGNARHRHQSSFSSSSALDADTRSLLLATAPFSAVRACLAILTASCAVAVLCLAALQEWSWPVLLPHWHLSVPGLTMTGVHLGWLLWWCLFVLATFDGRQMVENMRALVHHNNQPGTKGLAGVVCGGVAMVPAGLGVCFLLVCVGRTSLWRLDEEAEGDEEEDITSTTLSSSLGKSVVVRREAARDVARARDAQRVWVCRPDTLFLRESVPSLFGVLHALAPDLVQWHTLLTPPSAPSVTPPPPSSSWWHWSPWESSSRKTKHRSSDAADDGYDTSANDCAAAEAALQLFDIVVERLGHGAGRTEDTDAHDRRVLALLVRCSTEDHGDTDVYDSARADEDADDAAADKISSQNGAAACPRLTLDAALHRRREHHARKRRECLTEVMAYAGASTASTTVAERLELGRRRSTVAGRSQQATATAAADKRGTRERSAARTGPSVARSAETGDASAALDRLHRRRRESEYLEAMSSARNSLPSPEPSPPQRG